MFILLLFRRNIYIAIILKKEVRLSENSEYFKGNEYTVRGGNLVKTVLLPIKKDSTLKGKNLLPGGEQILSFESRLLYGRDPVRRKPNRKPQKLSVLQKCGKTTKYIQSP